MIFEIWTFIKNSMAALASGLGLMQDRNRAANAPEVVAAAKGADDQKLKDAAGSAIKNGDTDALRKML
jgi:hypothetical protein